MAVNKKDVDLLTERSMEKWRKLDKNIITHESKNYISIIESIVSSISYLIVRREDQSNNLSIYKES